VNKLDFGIMVLDSKHWIKFLNEKAAQIFRVEKEDMLHNSLTNFLSEDEVYAMFTFKQTHVDTLEKPELKIELHKEEKILLGYSVYQYTDEESGEDGYIISLKDITVHKELQEEKDRIERINSLGTMTTGIAHEIRNPLAGIKAIAQTMEEEMDEDDSKREYLRRIIRQTNRLDDILKSLYAFARPTKPNRGSYSIENILRDVIGSLQAHLRTKNIELIETLHSSLPDIYVDAKQIRQVISNILKNSIEAIKSQGEIRISAHSLENGHPVSKEHFKSLIQGKSYVEIHIHDNGCGISQENLDKVFNPFFTTKMMANGLGLTIVYQTVKENGGMIFMESEGHEGTDCYLILPAHN
jgi:nitrogen-specific signal transduction histidine kinase